MSMRKWIPISLILVLMVSLTACGAQPSVEIPAEQPTETTVAETTEETTEEATEASTEEPTVPAADSYPACLPEELIFPDLYAIDTDTCAIRIVSLTPDTVLPNFVVLTCELENRSEDIIYTFSTEGVSVDGAMSYGFIYEALLPGEKKECKLWIGCTDIEFQPLPCSHLQVTFRASALRRNDIVETVNIYPQGEEAAVHYVWEPKPGDIVAVDREDIRFALLECLMEEHYQYEMRVAMVNNTDRTLVFNATNVKVNGVELDPYFSDLSVPNSSSFGLLTWDYFTLSQNGITEVETVEFLLVCYDWNDPSASYILEQTVSFQLQ